MEVLFTADHGIPTRIPFFTEILWITFFELSLTTLTTTLQRLNVHDFSICFSSYRSWGASHENLVRSSSAMLPLRRRGDCPMRKWNRFRLRVIYAGHVMTKMWINQNYVWKTPMCVICFCYIILFNFYLYVDILVYVCRYQSMQYMVESCGIVSFSMNSHGLLH